MTSRFSCPECGGDFTAERLADADGERLFGVCPCGLASVEYSFASEFVGPPSSRAEVTDAAVWATVAPFSLEMPT